MRRKIHIEKIKKIVNGTFSGPIFYDAYGFCGNRASLTNRMKDVQTLQTSQLVDLLAEQTSIVTKLVSEKNFGDEYDKQKLFLKAIQTEIDLRKNTADIIPTNITQPPDFSIENKT